MKLGNYEDIRRLIDNALKAGIEKNLGHDYMDEIEERYKEEARNTIETPWNEINKYFRRRIRHRRFRTFSR